MLKEIDRVAAPRCLLVIETVNRDFLVKNFEQRGVAKMVEDIELHESRKLNLQNSSMENVWTFYQKRRDNSLKMLAKIPLAHRVYSLHELKGLIEKSGMELRRELWESQLPNAGYFRFEAHYDNRPETFTSAWHSARLFEIGLS